MKHSQQEQHSDPWVTASEIGNAAYCPYQLYLAKQGVRVDRQTKARIARGEQAHRQYNKQRQGRAGASLFLIALAVLFLLAWYFVQ